MPSGIYTITAPSGRAYVGSAVDMRRRWARHRKDLRSGKHGNVNLLRAAKKYGLDNLRFDAIIVCRPVDLVFFEQRAIDVLDPAYNIAPIAGSSLGIKRSAEFKAKVAAAMTGRIVSAETRAKMGSGNRGKKLSPERILRWRSGLEPTPAARAAFMHTPQSNAKRSTAMIGHQVSDETKAKISAKLKGRKHSPARIAAIAAGRSRAAIVQQNGS